MMDKNREAFEAWCMNQCNYDTSKRDRTGGYQSLRTTLAFKVWMASREEIELKKKPYCVWPDETHDDSYINGFNDALDEITSLGIRVKGNEE